ncbi:hypothetical protein FIU87_14135 [Bacillus sp. THAF10]|nr:hypothetical protein FIU87_14135 [Bacillus sp. THAF10]
MINGCSTIWVFYDITYWGVKNLDKRYYQGKLLSLKIVTTLLILLFLTMPYFILISHSVSALLIPITLLLFIVVDYLIVKATLED